jgi:hypothetical protein
MQPTICTTAAFGIEMKSAGVRGRAAARLYDHRRRAVSKDILRSSIEVCSLPMAHPAENAVVGLSIALHKAPDKKRGTARHRNG